MPDKDIFLNSGPSKPDVPKSTFDKSFVNHLTAKLGYLYPVLVEECPAGSSYKIRPDMAFDLMPLAMPLQSRMRAHLSVFKVPFRILMDSYDDFFSRVGNHVMPYISRSDPWAVTGSLADYMGIPTAQLAEVVKPTFVNWVDRGFYIIDNIGLGLPDIIWSDSVFEHLKSQFLQNYGIPLIEDNLVSSVQGSSNYQMVYSDVLSRPLVNGNLQFSVLSTSSFSVPSGSNSIFIDVLVSTRNSSYVLPYGVISTSGTTRTFNYSTASTQTAGTYKLLSSTTVTSTQFSGTLYQSKLNILIKDSEIDAINSLISHPDLDVRLAIHYSSALYNTFGYGSLGQPLLSTPQIQGFLQPSVDAQDGKLTVALVADIVPQFSYSASVGDYEASARYFDAVDGAAPKLPVNALPFRAYEFIYNYFFRNQQVDPFYKDGEISYNRFLTNSGDGADTTTPLELKHVPYEYDVFTTCLKSPQAGFAPLVGVTTNDADGLGTLHMVPLSNGVPNPAQAYDIGVQYKPDDGSIVGITNYEDVADKTSVMRLQEAIQFGISINDFRNVSAFQRLKERSLKAGFKYADLHKEFFGTTPPIGENFPEYIGGLTREIKIGKIQNTALSAEHPLGEFAGVGGVAGSGRPIKCFCPEHSYIIGLLWFSVTPTYSQAIAPHFLKSHQLEYFNPQFNALGPQPVPTHLLAPLQLTQDQLNDVFGYQRMFYDYVSRFDECHGEFRTSMRDYLLQRLFASKPELTENFINIHSEDLSDVWTYTVDSDKIFGYVSFDMKVRSEVARVAIPRIVG